MITTHPNPNPLLPQTAHNDTPCELGHYHKSPGQPPYNECMQYYKARACCTQSYYMQLGLGLRIGVEVGMTSLQLLLALLCRAALQSLTTVYCFTTLSALQSLSI